MVHEPNHNTATVISGNPDYAGEMKEREAAAKRGKKITNCCHNEVDESYGGKCPFCKAVSV